jgi:formylglycine-generating enzyme required for sulfatase activity/serine/threonine protein kinase
MTQQEFFKRYKYSIRTDKVGGGAFGTVYKAFDEILNREVAIKVSEVKIMGGKEFSLKDEFDAIKDVPVHPNIANYEELITLEMPNGIFDYAVMQFYKDGNLSSFIKSNPTFDQKEQVALDLLNGIIHLHTHKVVHRDLKPGNILIVKHGDKIIPVITDFGLSKNAEMEGQSRFSNSFGGGTLKYSSPEQLKAEKLRLNTDLWAYGVIVHEIFTGKNLFMAQNITGASAEAEKEIYEQIIGVDISSMINELPGKWQEVVKQCLVRDGAKRIKSGVAVKALIENGPSTEPPKETFTDDATQIMGNEPEEFIDDETIIDDGKSTQKKDPAKNKFIAKKEFQKTKTPAKPSKKKNPLVYAVPLVILIAVALFLWKPWAKEIEPSDLQTYNGYKEQAVNAYKKDSIEVALNYYKAAETFMKGLEIKQANELLVKEGVKDSIAAISARLEDIAKAKETEAWELAKKQNTTKSYKGYLAAYENGTYKSEADSAIVNIEAYLKSEAAKKRLAQEQSLKRLLNSFVYVKGGTFTMGCTSEQTDCEYWEKPAHPVTLSSFNIGKFEVTQSQWQAVMGSNPSGFKGCKECPVENVSWNDTQKFIKKLQKLTGKGFRLPTEAEWEFAARGGTRTRGYQYAGGNNLSSVAWFAGNSNKKTHPVGQKEPNELGLYDMSGNVMEWCNDNYGIRYYNDSPSTNPKGPSTFGSYRVVRGGAWSTGAFLHRVAYRYYKSPHDRAYSYRGLRLVSY